LLLDGDSPSSMFVNEGTWQTKEFYKSEQVTWDTRKRGL
jgi:hypothetical protein